MRCPCSDTDTVSGETFFLNLSGPSNVILGDNRAKATIREATEAFTFGGRTYLLTNPSNWGEAEQQARSFGGHLVTINDADEQTFLAGAYTNKNLWIGYSDAGQEYDRTTEEGFEWINGTSAYTNWRTGQPDNRSGQDFAFLNTRGNWEDSNGSANAQGIIEIPGTLDIPIADLTNRQIYTFGDSIYLLSNPGNWGQAQAEAQRFQGNLVTVNDGAEQTFLAGIFGGKTLWLGYSDSGKEGDYRWISGDTSAYSNWNGGQPDNRFEEDFAALGATGAWADFNGIGPVPGIIEINDPAVPILVAEDLSIIEPTRESRQAAFTVRRYGDSSRATTVNYSTANGTALAGTHYSAISGTLRFNPGEEEKTISVTINSDVNIISGETFSLNLSVPTNGIFGDRQAKAILREATDAVTFGGHTYLLTTPGTWGEAQEQAKAFGGNLVTINSVAEQAFLSGQYAGKNVWIGYSDAGQEYDITTKEGFEWVNGTSAYTNWAAGQPSNRGNSDFVAMGSRGTWFTIGSNANYQGIIEIPNMLAPTPTPNPTPTPPKLTPNPTPTLPISPKPTPTPTSIAPPPTSVPGITIVGNRLDNRFRGGEGNDRILGKKGKDRLYGLGGNDILVGGAGRDRLKGGDGDDLLKGGKDNDRLWGNDGIDRLIGGKGRDRLVGGNNADVFVFSKGLGFDMIRDFEDGEDFLSLPRTLGFADLSFEQQRRNLMISNGSDKLAVLRGVNINQITRADFT